MDQPPVRRFDLRVGHRWLVAFSSHPISDADALDGRIPVGCQDEGAGSEAQPLRLDGCFKRRFLRYRARRNGFPERGADTKDRVRYFAYDSLDFSALKCPLVY